MKISASGLQLIKSFEGCLKPIGGGAFVPYICPAGVLTIGWGHTNHHGQSFDQAARWTQAECDAALAEDMEGFERAVDRLVTVPLNQGQFDALVSFAYNCGEGALQKSTLLRKLNASDYDGAGDEFGKWVKGGGRVLNGLVRRRAAESQLFRSQPPIVPADHTPMPQQVDPPEDDEAPPAPAPAPVPVPPRQPDDPGVDPADASPPPSGTPFWRRWLPHTSGYSGTFGSGWLTGQADAETVRNVAIGAGGLAVVTFVLALYLFGRQRIADFVARLIRRAAP